MATELKATQVKDEAEFDTILKDINVDNEVAQQQSDNGEVVLSTVVANLTDASKKEKLIMKETHFWAGSGPTNLPDLPFFNFFLAKQKGKASEGVKWGLAYANGTDSTARMFVVAFDSASGKAYAEARPIGDIDWNVVEVNLGNSGSKDVGDDPVYGGRTYAEINGLLATVRFLK